MLKALCTVKVSARGQQNHHRRLIYLPEKLHTCNLRIQVMMYTENPRYGGLARHLKELEVRMVNGRRMRCQDKCISSRWGMGGGGGAFSMAGRDREKEGSTRVLGGGDGARAT